MFADDLFCRMLNEISDYGARRQSADAASPCQQEVEEGPFGRQYTLYHDYNVVRSRELNMAWAAANVLHFFAGTEDAGVLRRYNSYAERFLTGDKWHGAYGAIAMPQIRECVKLLLSSPHTRRAIVSMGDVFAQDINRPACWSFLHFLMQGGDLHMYVYQRSLNVWGVMPYDAVLLTNIHKYVATATSNSCGKLLWAIGSLHTTSAAATHGERELRTMYAPYALLSEPAVCVNVLHDPECSTFMKEYCDGLR